MYCFVDMLSNPPAHVFEPFCIVLKMFIPGLVCNDQGSVKSIFGNIYSEYWLYHVNSSGKLDLDVGQANRNPAQPCECKLFSGLRLERLQMLFGLVSDLIKRGSNLRIKL